MLLDEGRLAGQGPGNGRPSQPRRKRGSDFDSYSNVDQNFDSYSVEYTFADNTTLLVKARSIEGCRDEFASYAHGTKGSAIISTSVHTPALTRIYGTQNIDNEADLVTEDSPAPVQADASGRYPVPEPGVKMREY